MKIFNIESILHATVNSLDGFKAAFKEEHAVREILFLSSIGIPLAFWIADSFLSAILLVIPFFLCLIVELLNTAIENICDRITTDYDLFIKKAKDMGSTAQFISQALLVLTWLIYFVM